MFLINSDSQCTSMLSEAEFITNFLWTVLCIYEDQPLKTKLLMSPYLVFDTWVRNPSNGGLKAP